MFHRTVPEYAYETDACFDLYGAEIYHTDKYTSKVRSNGFHVIKFFDKK